jgi:hypothetical protein
MTTRAVQEVLHYPRLDTVIMVEESIKKAKEYPTKAELLRKLPKKVMYQTLLLILDYLQKYFDTFQHGECTLQQHQHHYF